MQFYSSFLHCKSDGIVTVLFIATNILYYLNSFIPGNLEHEHRNIESTFHSIILILELGLIAGLVHGYKSRLCSNIRIHPPNALYFFLVHPIFLNDFFSKVLRYIQYYLPDSCISCISTNNSIFQDYPSCNIAHKSSKVSLIGATLLFFTSSSASASISSNSILDFILLYSS